MSAENSYNNNNNNNNSLQTLSENEFKSGFNGFNGLISGSDWSDCAHQLASDELLFKQLIGSGLGAKSTSAPKAMTATTAMTMNEQIIAISHGIDVLNASLHSLVSHKYNDLLAQSTQMDTLEEVLTHVQTRIRALMSGVHKIRAKLVEPYGRVCERIVLLNRLQMTCDLLRKTIRVIHLAKRLNESPLDATEPTLLARQMTKAGQYVFQIDSIVAEDTNDCLSRVQVIKADLRAMLTVRTALLQKADQMLESGLSEEDINQISASLQVFYSLQVLDQRVRQISDEKQEYICKSVKEAIDVSNVSALGVNHSRSSGPGRAQIPMTIAQNSWIRWTLRQNFDALIDKIYCAFTQMSLIYGTVGRKRDSLTNCCLSDQIESPHNEEGLNQFWTHVISSLSEQLCKAANDSTLLKQSIETEFPNYLNSLSQLWKRISRDHKELNPEKGLRASVQAFESAYLSRSLSLLFDSVNKVFADAKETSLSAESNYCTTVPSIEDIESIVRHICSELHVSSIDALLSKSVAKNVTKTINLFVVKCEQLTSMDGHSTQVIGPLTNSQRLNATIVDRLETFRIQVNNLLVSSNCPIECLQIVEQSMTCIENLMTNTINPLINSVMDAIEAILLTMHSENYSQETDLNASDVRASEYMKELQTFIARVNNEYLNQLVDCEVTRNCVDRVGNRTIELFLRQITLIRPLSQTGRMRIAADFAQLEMALTPLCQPIGRLGKTYRILRSFKPLLFQSAESIAISGAVGHLIPYSLVLQFLISSFAPIDIKSPHQYMNWSQSRYNKWLDEHSDEKQRLSLIKNSLEYYVKSIRQSQGKAFASVYPILLELLQKAMHKSSAE